MQVTCVPREDLESCCDCPDKKKCRAYWLIMDLTAERNICPFNKMLEECPITKRRVPSECDLDLALEWILNQEDYPQLADFRRQFGWHKGTELIQKLELKGWIIIDNESSILVTKIDNPKLQKLVDESVRI